MARARSPNSIEAEEMYKRGMKLVDIAKKLDVPASTVRRWKSTELGWGCKKKKTSARKRKKSSVRTNPNLIHICFDIHSLQIVINRKLILGFDRYCGTYQFQNDKSLYSPRM